jgi:spermidine/putrescine-binding protein
VRVLAPEGLLPEEVVRDFEAAKQCVVVVETYASAGEPPTTDEPVDLVLALACDVDLAQAKRPSASRWRTIDPSRLPHAADLAVRFRDAPADPGNVYSVPVLFSVAGVAHAETVAAPSSWDRVLDPAAHDAQAPARTALAFAPDARLAVVATLLSLRRAPNSVVVEDYEAAATRLRGLVPFVRSVRGASAISDRDAQFAVVWSGPLPQGVRFSVPADATVVTTVRAMLPVGETTDVPGAYALLEYLLDPARNAEWAGQTGTGSTTAPTSSPYSLNSILGDRAPWWLRREPAAEPYRARLWAALESSVGE